MHNKKLKWKSDPEREEYDCAGWEVRRTGSYVRVTGSCPRCLASGQSDFTNADGELGDAAVEREVSSHTRLHVLGFTSGEGPGNVAGSLDLEAASDYVVMLECQCGDDVHTKGKNGCGARWNVRVPHV